jgi:hypothetical protein
MVAELKLPRNGKTKCFDGVVQRDRHQPLPEESSIHSRRFRRRVRPPCDAQHVLGALDFEVPIVPGRRWYRIVDTARPSPEDIVETARQVPIEGHQVRVEGRSVWVLLSR